MNTKPNLQLQLLLELFLCQFKVWIYLLSFPVYFTGLPYDKKKHVGDGPYMLQSIDNREEPDGVVVFQLIKIGYVGAIKSLIDNALDKSRIINSYVVHADDTQGNFTASKRCLGKESHTILCHMWP